MPFPDLLQKAVRQPKINVHSIDTCTMKVAALLCWLTPMRPTLPPSLSLSGRRPHDFIPYFVTVLDLA